MKLLEDPMGSLHISRPREAPACRADSLSWQKPIAVSSNVQ